MNLLNNEEINECMSIGEAQADAQIKMRDLAWKDMKDMISVQCDEDMETLRDFFFRVYNRAVNDVLINMITTRSEMIKTILEEGDQNV